MINQDEKTNKKYPYNECKQRDKSTAASKTYGGDRDTSFGHANNAEWI